MEIGKLFLRKMAVGPCSLQGDVSRQEGWPHAGLISGMHTVAKSTGPVVEWPHEPCLDDGAFTYTTGYIVLVQPRSAQRPGPIDQSLLCFLKPKHHATQRRFGLLFIFGAANNQM